MASQQGLFEEFPKTSKEEWAAQWIKDLKGKPLSELDWEVEANITQFAAYTEEEIAPSPTLTAGRIANTWGVGEYIEVEDMGQANAAVLEGLEGGVNAPLFRLHHLPDLQELAVLLEGVEPAFITVHFALQHPDKDPAVLFRHLIYYARRRGLKLSDIKGSVDFDPLLDWANPPFDALARIITFADRHTPHFKVLQVNGQVLHDGVENTSRELALILSKGVAYLEEMMQRGIEPAVTNGAMQFSLALSTSYFVEIAKIRALKILWANVLTAYDLEEVVLPPIAAHTAPESQTDNREYNMIQAATQAMAAATGGADYVYVLPADAVRQEHSSSFSRRIARNVQHLLQMETHLDRVVDPAAGSYYIETLTRKLCEEAWHQFQEMEEKGGYMAL
ncbi:MAG: methylmalonyl-CoA mutase family protein [Saprospiraceae bacterium]